MNTTKYAMRLYAVTDSSWLRGRSLVQMVEEAILGGATFVQLREKELDQEAFIALDTAKLFTESMLKEIAETDPATLEQFGAGVIMGNENNIIFNNVDGQPSITGINLK